MIGEIYKDVTNQHECAKRIFKDCYSFDIKQKDILFEVENTLRKYQAEQLVDQNKVAALNKKMDKRQVVIDNLLNRLEITKNLTEDEINKTNE